MKLVILPYKKGSKSVKLLRSALNCKVIKLENSRFRHRPSKYVINWGNSTPHDRVSYFQCFNQPNAVAYASNKLGTFTTLKAWDVPHVEFTQSKQTATEWLDSGHTVFIRHLINASGGRGISIYNSDSGELPDAPLYTKKFKTKYEYRVHVAFGSVIDVTMKRLRSDAPENRVRGIRNYENGWIFARNDMIPLSERNQQIAIKGVEALGLDFGAVDLLVDRNDMAVICEINTAPGIEGTTLDKYVASFQQKLRTLT